LCKVFLLRLHVTDGDVAMVSPDAALRLAMRADPSDRLISPMGDDFYVTLLGVVPGIVAVMRLATEVECRPEEVLAWYRYVRIRELGSLTAASLVSMGRTQEVIGFLQSILRGERD
jgi:hypothetical protein